MAKQNRLDGLSMNTPKELYACLYAQEFPAQALLRLRPEMRNHPFVVMEGEPPLQYVCSLNAKAHNLGITRGMTKVEVDTFPSITLSSRSLAEESTAEAALLECAGTFSPRVENQSKDNVFICVIDIVGTEKLFGPPEKLAKLLLNKSYELGVTASVAISYNFHTAICIAKGMPSITIVPTGHESHALASRPLTVLNLTQEQTETFSLWGIRTLGMLAALPEKDLIARVGQEGKRLRQLARGESTHLFLPVEPALMLNECMELDSPIETLDSLLFVLNIMIEHLILRANARIFALTSVTITLTLENAVSNTFTRTVRPSLPSNDRQLWLKLLHLDLEAHPPQSPILSLTLLAEPGCTRNMQLGLFSPQLPEPMRLDVTLARIQAIVGENSIGRAVLKDTHQPDSFRMEPFTLPARSPQKGTSTQTRAAMRQLRPGKNIKVQLCGKRPETFFFCDKRYIVEHAYGPWLTGGDWWNSNTWELEQWDLVSRAQDGALLCCCVVYEVLQSCWQMVALYD